MSNTPDGGPAFPIVMDDDQGEHLTVEYGLTMRDWFAGMVIQGLWANPDTGGSYEELAKEAYQQADAMLKARDEKR